MTFKLTHLDAWDKREFPYSYCFKLFWESTHDNSVRWREKEFIRSWLKEQFGYRPRTYEFYAFNICYSYVYFDKASDATMFKLRFG